jgi:hypothetical protein
MGNIEESVYAIKTEEMFGEEMNMNLPKYNSKKHNNCSSIKEVIEQTVMPKFEAYLKKKMITDSTLGGEQS